MEFKEWEAQYKERMKSMHYWGDKWQHWQELYDAEQFIKRYVYSHSLCTLDSKEKWGQLRYQAIHPPGASAWNIRIKLPWKKKVVKLGGTFYTDNVIFEWPVCWVFDKWQDFGQWTLKQAVNKASKKFPNVVKEITADMR